MTNFEEVKIPKRLKEKTFKKNTFETRPTYGLIK
jgi:hypothetical protein